MALGAFPPMISFGGFFAWERARLDDELFLDLAQGYGSAGLHQSDPV
jgi:hypothetical protein